MLTAVYPGKDMNETQERNTRTKHKNMHIICYWDHGFPFGPVMPRAYFGYCNLTGQAYPFVLKITNCWTKCSPSSYRKRINHMRGIVKSIFYSLGDSRFENRKKKEWSTVQWSGVEKMK
jgi:hypothetical protein